MHSQHNTTTKKGNDKYMCGYLHNLNKLNRNSQCCECGTDVKTFFKQKFMLFTCLTRGMIIGSEKFGFNGRRGSIFVGIQLFGDSV